MTSEAFDIQLIPEFSGAVTDMAIVEWLEDMDMVCELYAMYRVEHVLPLQLQGGNWAKSKEWTQRK